MRILIKKILLLTNNQFFPYLFLILLGLTVYYKFVVFGKIPFPGDLLVSSYSPWFDYYKLPTQNPLISDVFSQFFLWKYLAMDSFKNLEWPLWNIHSFTGTPLLATYHSATLYPLNFLLLFPKYMGWGIFILSQTLIALITSYLLLFYWTKSRLSSFLGAIIFAFSSSMTTWLELGTAVHAMAWLPLCFYAVELFLHTGKIRYSLLLITGLLFIILAGNAQVTTYSFIIIFIYYILNSQTKDFKQYIYRTSFFSLVLLISILLSAIQLIPSLDLLKKSIRLTEAYTSEYNYGLLPLKDGLKFFIADFFGNPVTRNFWGNLNYSETSGFVGSLTLPLLIYSFLFLKKTKKNIFFLILLLATLILAFDNPISQWIYRFRIPLLTSSYASRILFISTFAISILGALSLNQILKNKEKQDEFIKVVLWAWAIIVGIIVGIFVCKFTVWNLINLESRESYLKYYLNDHNYQLINFSIAFRNSSFSFVLLSSILTFCLILVKFKSKIRTKNLLQLLITAILILSTLDLSRYFLKFNPFVSPSLIFPNVPAIDFLKSQKSLFRVGREHAETLPPNTWTAYSLQSYEGYDPIYLNQYGKFMHFLNGGDIRTGNSSRYAEIASNYSSPYLDAANVKFFIAVLRDSHGYTPGDLLNFKFKETPYRIIFKDKSAAILENPNALERVYFAPFIQIKTESEVMDQIMTDKTFDPRKNILLSKQLNIRSVTGKGSIEIVKYSPNKIQLNTDNPADEVLVLADQFEDGWKAKIDNHETLVSPANLIFRAVKIPSGKHQITFWYWPKSFEIGLEISLLSLFLICLLAIFSVKVKKF